MSRAEDRLARILAMVPWIVAHDGPAVEDVCARFRCTPEQLTSDIELLYLCGLYPYTPDLLIEAEIDDGRVWINYADYLSRPLRLTPAEGLALIAAASTLLATPGTDADGPLARGLAKLAASIGASADPLEVALTPVTPGVMEALAGAIEQRRQIEIDYYTFGKDERSWRTVEPAGLFLDAGHWYLSAYCHHAGDERIFRADRIFGFRARSEPRMAPAAPTAPPLFARPPDREVTLLLTESARWVVEQYPCEEVTARPQGLEVRFAVHEWAWLDRLLLRLGPDATILAAPAGWPGVRAVAERMIARYLPGAH